MLKQEFGIDKHLDDKGHKSIGSVARLVAKPNTRRAGQLSSTAAASVAASSGGPEGWRLGPSANCFVFIVGFSVPLSVPLAAALYWALKQATPLETLSVTAIGGLGVAALAATILQFFHSPFTWRLCSWSSFSWRHWVELVLRQ
jgi:hypothetical protein